MEQKTVFSAQEPAKFKNSATYEVEWAIKIGRHENKQKDTLRNALFYTTNNRNISKKQLATFSTLLKNTPKEDCSRIEELQRIIVFEQQTFEYYAAQVQRLLSIEQQEEWYLD